MIEKIELEGVLVVCKGAVGKGMFASVLKQRKMDVLNSKEFKGTSVNKSTDKRQAGTANGAWEKIRSNLPSLMRRKMVGEDHEEDGNENSGGGNGRPHNGKWKPNNRLKGPMKCFFCDGPHMVRDYVTS
ncbi:hypothetical protein Goshw_028519 [Gossypium schwendimanii]|uniref:Uncharacterized protein n=1 Tax=Gossypium schwendimanii TaxID=34291 RepID=A0A7J9KZZ8_GOSSC|nr:hypothetical protein [Gossypium schwendimanii]